MWGIHQSPVNSPLKGQWCGTLIFPLICAWIHGCENQSWGWWFEMPSRPLWCHRNEFGKLLAGLPSLVTVVVFSCPFNRCSASFLPPDFHEYKKCIAGVIDLKITKDRTIVFQENFWQSYVGQSGSTLPLFLGQHGRPAFLWPQERPLTFDPTGSVAGYSSSDRAHSVNSLSMFDLVRSWTAFNLV